MNHLDDKEIKVVSEPHPGSEKPNDTMMETDATRTCPTEHCRNYCMDNEVLCSQCTQVGTLECKIKELMEEIKELREYNVTLETNPDGQSEERRLNDTGADLMSEAMSVDLANKNKIN